jgi:hypothetical protein
MRSIALGVAVALAWGPALWAADDKPDKKDQTPADEVKSLIADYEKAQTDFYTKYGEAKTDEERTKLQSEMPQPDKTVARLFELAQKNPKDESVCPKALIWAIQYAGYNAAGVETRSKALDQMCRDHAKSDQVGQVVLSLAYIPSPAAERFLRAVVESNPKTEIKGKATYALGEYLKHAAENASNLKDHPDNAKSIESCAGKDAIKYLQESDPAKMAKEAERLFETAAEKYADIEVYPKHTVGDLAKGELFEIRNLAIGMIAPEIEGDDLDGKGFKLSEYRGKVVVLDFWGNW